MSWQMGIPTSRTMDPIADVEDLQLDRQAGVVRIFRVVAESRVDRRGRRVDPDTQASEAALPFDSGRQPGAVGQVDALLGEAEDEGPRRRVRKPWGPIATRGRRRWVVHDPFEVEAGRRPAASS